MDKKDLRFWVSTSLTGLIVGGTCIGLFAAQPILSTISNGASYTLYLSKSENRPSGAIGTSESDFSGMTASGNALSFGALALDPSDPTLFGTFTSGGYLGNKSPIHGISSITFTSGEATPTTSVAAASSGVNENERACTFYYGYDNKSSFTSFQGYPYSKKIDFALPNGGDYTFEKGDELVGNPDYFFFTTSSASLKLSLIKITYSCAASSPQGYGYTFDSLSGGYFVSSYEGYATETSISDTYDDGTNGTYPIMGYSANAFQNNDSFKTITLGANISAYDPTAFSSCWSLETFDASASSITEIQDTSFTGLTSLKTVKLPKGINHIGNHAFESCSNLSTIIYGGTVSEWSIGAGATLGTNAFSGVDAGHVTCSDGEVAIA